MPTATWICIQESVTSTQLSDTCSPIWTPRSGAVLGEVGAWTRSQSSALQVKMQILLDWPSLQKMCQGKEKNSLFEILTSSLAVSSSLFHVIWVTLMTTIITQLIFLSMVNVTCNVHYNICTFSTSLICRYSLIVFTDIPKHVHENKLFQFVLYRNIRTLSIQIEVTKYLYQCLTNPDPEVTIPTPVSDSKKPYLPTMFGNTKTRTDLVNMVCVSLEVFVVVFFIYVVQYWSQNIDSNHTDNFLQNILMLTMWTKTFTNIPLLMLMLTEYI